MALNALDGMMANLYHLKSKKGEILNELGDVLSDIFIFLPFIKIANASSVLLFIALAIVNEFCGVLTKAVSGNRRYDGPMGKSDRAFLGGLYCLLLFFYAPIASNSHLIFTGACTLMVIGSFLRLKNSLK
jgi:CDP-diacylglycerol--glycerol-3-phosphate 3-phosphatidyltransferase